ncbi:class I SAM-dependent methyltransferase [Kineosporia sp. R_H_3]|uniref:class I SAM-dependent methyltransferase n=1 Tax=Kineosporia sp. R_H_3 TaxID=1961848 RepID=UPI000B4BF0B4
MSAVDDVESRGLAAAGYRPAGAEETVRANRHWWDGASREYLDEHGDFLGADDFVWCPEGLREDDARLLGDPAALAGRRVLEVGSGAAQCARWLAARGADVVALDLSMGMLAEGRRLGTPGPAGRTDARPVGLVQGDARVLPFADASFDLAFSAYGAVPFVADPQRVMADVARVLRPGGRWVFSLTHPVRWAFPDDPSEHGLTANRSYFDRTPYVEEDDAGEVVYAEHHRTLGDRVRDVVAAGLVLEDLVEPEWPDGHDRVWGGWSPLRGRLLPGTAILVTRRP